MKKYKLVKCFPGSPPIGTVATKTHLGYLTGGYGVLFIEDVENYSEFWEPIKEPEFQILAAKTSVKVSLTAENTSTEIYKVLRLSDNAVFSVGDKLKYISIKEKVFKTIKSFSLKDNSEILVYFNEDGNYTAGFKLDLLNKYEHYKCPLFITEDKAEIFNGDNYWFVVKSDLEIVKAWIPRLHVCDWDYSGEYKKPPLGHVQFSTEKAAKDWIDLNKPMYSKKQIMDAALVKYVTGTILLHIKDIK